MRCPAVRRLLDVLLDNPILLKELRIGLRERKIFLIQSLYLVVLGSATALFLFSASAPTDLLELPDRGRLLHGILFWSQLAMVVLITPSLTCGQISGERENHSLDLLRASRLRTVEIVLGKLGYALAYVGLLLASSLPMVAVVFLLGGVAPGEVAASYGVLALAATLVGLLGLFFSAREQKTGHATNPTGSSSWPSSSAWEPFPRWRRCSRAARRWGREGSPSLCGSISWPTPADWQPSSSSRSRTTCAGGWPTSCGWAGSSWSSG